jgi:hypothetical protein
MIKETTEDGWGCVPELRSVTICLSNISNDVYEIKNCVRSTSLINLVEGMKAELEEALYLLDQIDTSIEYKTVDDE